MPLVLEIYLLFSSPLIRHCSPPRASSRRLTETATPPIHYEAPGLNEAIRIAKDQNVQCCQISGSETMTVIVWDEYREV